LEQRLKDAKTPDDKEFYRKAIEATNAERKKLLADLGETAKKLSSDQPAIHITYSALERRTTDGGVAFMIASPADHLFSVDWQFTAYLIRSKEVEQLGNPAVRETMTVSDVVSAGRALYLGGVVLHKLPSGIYMATGLNVLQFRLKKEGWLTAKLALDSDDIFVGTILTGIPPNPQDAFWSFFGLNVGFFPLSLEDPSFSAVRVKHLTEKHGLISLRGVLAPIFNPFLLTKLTQTDLDVNIGGKKLSEYEMLAVRAVGPRVIESLAAAETKR
jgi:hypothetical protein